MARRVENFGSLAVASNLFVATAAGSASLSKQKFPGAYTITLPSPGSGIAGITALTESSATVGAVIAPESSWGGVLLDFAGVGAADLTLSVEIGRFGGSARMPTVLATADLKSITTSGTFTANFNPFTGAAVSATTYRLFDLVTLTAKTNLAEVLTVVGGAEDNTPAQLLLDVSMAAYYYVLVTSLGTLTQALCAATPAP